MMRFLFSLCAFLSAHTVFADCRISGLPSQVKSDVFAKILAKVESCPQEVLALREVFERDGLQLKPSLVANRGFHNPTLGSFSLFERGEGSSAALQRVVESGELFFGHFIEKSEAGLLKLAQSPAQGALMVELISWDGDEGVFRFYELIGNGSTGEWFYRGDSQDIFHDNAHLHLQKNPQDPQFGDHLRCTACHANGGPILKELSVPHNDWWSVDRPLPFGKARLDQDFKDLAENLVSAEELAQSVRAGMEKLYGHARFQAFQKKLSLPERLRPLFCPVEVNFESDGKSLDLGKEIIEIPSAQFVDPRLGTIPLQMSSKDYLTALKSLQAKFPLEGTDTQIDADHAWLGPVKAFSDQLAVKLIRNDNVVDSEFVSDVLAVDFIHPVFSSARCGLLRLVPDRWTPDWKKRFRERLKKSTMTEASELLANMEQEGRDFAFHSFRFRNFLTQCQKRLRERQYVVGFVRLLQQRRIAIASSEVSQNPRGQILEPGFRVIFPEMTSAPSGKSWQLDPETCIPTEKI